MQYTKKDIPHIPLTEFMAALGEKPVKTFEDITLYYAPQREDLSPMLIINTKTNRWYDHATEKGGDIIDLAKALKMDPYLYKNPRDFIIKKMDQYEGEKAFAAMMRQPLKPKVITLDIRKLKLTDFMKALGLDPVSTDGNLRVYKAPYDPTGEPTMVINTETNLWRDTKSGSYGGIYDLAYEMTGSANMSELNFYIAGQMGEFDKRKTGLEQKPKVDQPKQEPEKPKWRMRL